MLGRVLSGTRPSLFIGQGLRGHLEKIFPWLFELVPFRESHSISDFYITSMTPFSHTAATDIPRPLVHVSPRFLARVDHDIDRRGSIPMPLLDRLFDTIQWIF